MNTILLLTLQVVIEGDRANDYDYKDYDQYNYDDDKSESEEDNLKKHELQSILDHYQPNNNNDTKATTTTSPVPAPTAVKETTNHSGRLNHRQKV
jgi:hypothetical protein